MGGGSQQLNLTAVEALGSGLLLGLLVLLGILLGILLGSRLDAGVAAAPNMVLMV